jgi:predicted RNA-binding Zn-ribbon protein involved in translation (DUF1610 family)
MATDINISNIWRIMKFFCGSKTEDGVCGEELKMEMQRNQVMFVCPKCGQTTPYYDVEKFMQKVQKAIVEDAEDGIESNLTNYKHKLISRIDRKAHEFTVTKHTSNEMKVSIRND